MQNNIIEAIEKETSNGYVIVNNNHPAGVKPFISSNSFRFTKRQCINDFVRGSGSTWKNWYNNYNFRCVRSVQSIEIIKTAQAGEKEKKCLE